VINLLCQKCCEFTWTRSAGKRSLLSWEWCKLRSPMIIRGREWAGNASIFGVFSWSFFAKLEGSTVWFLAKIEPQRLPPFFKVYNLQHHSFVVSERPCSIEQKNSKVVSDMVSYRSSNQPLLFRIPLLWQVCERPSKSHIGVWAICSGWSSFAWWCPVCLVLQCPPPKTMKMMPMQTFQRCDATKAPLMEASFFLLILCTSGIPPI
jgi:hypothetical protein